MFYFNFNHLTGNGYGRSEAVCTLLLQRANVARRVYATIVNVKTNTDGFKEQGLCLSFILHLIHGLRN